MSFNPDEYNDDVSEARKRAPRAEEPELTRAGEYLLALVYLADAGETEQKGTPFGRFKVRVIHGPLSGSVFYDRVFFAPTTYKRLAMFLAAMRRMRRWELPEQGCEMLVSMLGAPFVCSVEIERATVDGERRTYTRFKFPEPREWTPAEKASAEKFSRAWAADAEAAKEKGRSFAVARHITEAIEKSTWPPAAPEKRRGGGGGSSGGGSRSSAASDDAPHPGDGSDDIPF